MIRFYYALMGIMFMLIPSSWLFLTREQLRERSTNEFIVLGVYLGAGILLFGVVSILAEIRRTRMEILAALARTTLTPLPLNEAAKTPVAVTSSAPVAAD